MRWDYRARNAHCPGANVTNSAHGLSKILGEYRALPGGTGFQPVCLYLHRLEAGATQASPSIIASPRDYCCTQARAFLHNGSRLAPFHLLFSSTRLSGLGGSRMIRLLTVRKRIKSSRPPFWPLSPLGRGW